MPLAHYQARLQAIASDAAVAQGRFEELTRYLIFLGIAFAALGFWTLQNKRPLWYPAPALPAGLVLFIARQKAGRRLQSLELLKAFYERGISRLTADWDAAGDDGARFEDHDHLYASDLDLFGRGSLFQLMNTARTSVGKQALANWMKQGADLGEVLARQAAVEELRGRSDLRELLTLVATAKPTDVRAKTFEDWLDAPARSFSRFVPAVAAFFAVGTVLIPVLGALKLIAADSVLPAWTTWVACQLAFASSFRDRVRGVIEDSRLASFELPMLIELAKILSTERFEARLLLDLQQTAARALEPLQRLKRLFRLLEARENELFMLPCYALLWGTQLTIAVERWRALHQHDFRDWLAALGSFEALNAMACYAFEHPQDPFPQLNGQAPAFEAEGLGHPLIPEDQCVRNDVTLDAGRRFLLVSGSNMSGKSTFLRAIGLNAVLAWMGAPVRAGRLRVSSLTVGTSMRLQDSLESGKSHFLAEMTRLRLLLDGAGGAAPLLFLIDEVMSGTNSHDRRIASEVVVRRLLDSNSIGLVTTHDLTLTEIAEGLDPIAANVHFTDSTDTGGLDFDYKLKDGIARTSNGLAILEMLGLGTLPRMNANGRE